MKGKHETLTGEGGRIHVRSDQTTAEIFVKPPDTHPVYAKIGRIASEWSHFEHALDEIIWLLCEGDSTKLGCVTGQMMGHAPRYNAIIALLTARDADAAQIDSVEQLRNKGFSASELRNRIVHDAWYITSVSKEASLGQFRSMPPRDLRFGIADIADSDFVKAQQKIQRCYESAISLWNDLYRAHLVKRRASQKRRQ